MLDYIDQKLQTNFQKAILDYANTEPFHGYRIQVRQTVSHNEYQVIFYPKEQKLPKGFIKRMTRMSKQYNKNTHIRTKYNQLCIFFPREDQT